MSNWNLTFMAWVTASLATAGSLFFSEVMHFPPCALCWYQRICMYPLIVIFLPALISFDRPIIKFSLPLVTLGWLISIYHNFVYFGLISESLSPCSQGVSCKTQFITWFGFVDIPQLSLLAFSLLLLELTLLRRSIRSEQ